MSTKTRTDHKICRRVGEPVCESPSCPARDRSYPPGEQGRNRRRQSEYRKQLLEKQKLKRKYGLRDGVLRRYFERSYKSNENTGHLLIELLERRLDNMLFRMGFARSRAQARQFVVHGHIEVNGKKMDSPSYEVDSGDVIAPRENSRGMDRFEEVREAGQAQPLDYIDVDFETLAGTVIELPRRNDIPVELDESLVVEFYSR
jgi:small subunit ribosomal protein S4